MSSAEAIIDLAALSHNFSLIRQMIHPSTAIMPMIKANAYGHGIVEVARRLTEAHAFGVATLSEALFLREQGIFQPLYVMRGFQGAEEAELCAAHGLIAVIHHPTQVACLEKITLTTALKLWLKVDTGMHRLGFGPDIFLEYYNRLLKSDNVVKPLGVMSHFADSNENETFTREQFTLFTAMTQHHVGPRSLANSAALMRYPEMQFDLVRPGIMLYGVSPFVDQTAEELGLKPVMTLKSHLIAYKTVRAGERVGYGLTWRAERDTEMGIVGIGYGDGYPRHLPSGTPVLINTQECPLIGRVSMDMIAIDISSLKNAKIGDEVVLWGTGLPIERISNLAKTIGYELLCQVTGRVQRCILNA